MSAGPIEQVSDATQLWQAARDANLGAVFVGGIVGGLLQPVVARLNPRTDNPPSINFLYSPLLGFAAAGISVHVVADSNTTNPIHLLFFALLCGLAFPSVLTAAVDNVTRRTNQVQQQVADIAEKAKSDGADTTVEAAGELKTTLAANPAHTLSPGLTTQIETMGQQAVNNIAHTALSIPSSASRIVEQLHEVATIARNAGWNDTAEAADEQAEKLAPDANGEAGQPGGR